VSLLISLISFFATSFFSPFVVALMADVVASASNDTELERTTCEPPFFLLSRRAIIFVAAATAVVAPLAAADTASSPL
jgi:hypothetical protein